MYQPPHFREDRLDIQHALIRAHPLGLLVTVGKAGLAANPIPFALDEAASQLGTLRAHLSRANPQWRDFDPAQEALVVFQGAETYITPSWYETKREHGKVVPTWNYAIVQAHGRMRVIEDPAWLLEQITSMTSAQEAARPEPWAVDDTPPEFLAAQLKGIVGVEIEITRIEGKWKVSQNRPEADRRGVAAGLRALGDESALHMAELVDTRGA
ncbi:FMN-binding negative transcriptional regulator [Microvirga makkahensis]|uniref:FMN-binding negative transcriptional regulator n=1 Tax=Microvirga makkahensis TaxID=1128670 RepID=A0A7X3MTG4_9HYPH|nr:FMN-binding negative transcriptional regulator [Microvirga makkahensis]MXQ12938.1 FMN-binding negative transcriptional regulator [Microvirga makkahensis]